LRTTGVTYVTVRVHGPKGHRDVKIMVDTGASFTQLSPSLARDLGISPTGATSVVLADGRKSRAGIAKAVIEYKHSKQRVQVVIQDGPLLLGITSLKALHLRVNAVDGTLEPTSFYISRAGWLLVYVALLFVLFLISYYGDSNSGTLQADYYVGNYVLVVAGTQIPIPLIFYSLIIALVIYIPVRIFGWGVSQLVGKHYAKAILAFMFIALIVGFGIARSPYSTVVPSTSDFYHALQGASSIK